MGLIRQCAEALAWVLICVAIVYSLARATAAQEAEMDGPAFRQPAVGYLLKSEMERWVWEAEQTEPAEVRAIERWEREHAHCIAREVCRPLRVEPWTGR